MGKEEEVAFWPKFSPKTDTYALPERFVLIAFSPYYEALLLFQINKNTI